jgi:uncharacterized protein (TIRG00374 family)
MGSFLNSRVGAALRYGLTILLMVYLWLQTDWGQFDGTQTVDWRYLVAGVLLAGVAYPLQAWRWQLLLAVQGILKSTTWVHRVFWISQFFNSFLPGGIAGDTVRFGYLWKSDPTKKMAVVATLLVDRFLGLLCLCALAALAFFLYLQRHGEQRELLAIWQVSLVAVLLITVAGWSLTRTRFWEPYLIKRWGEARTKMLRDVAIAFGGHRGLMIVCVLLSLGTWLADFAALWLLAKSVGLTVSPLVITVAATAAYLVAALPISVGGHGLRESTLLVVMGWMGFSSSTEPGLLLLATLFLVTSIGWSAVGGLVYAGTILAQRIRISDPN